MVRLCLALCQAFKVLGIFGIMPLLLCLHSALCPLGSSFIYRTLGVFNEAWRFYDYCKGFYCVKTTLTDLILNVNNIVDVANQTFVLIFLLECPVVLTLLYSIKDHDYISQFLSLIWGHYYQFCGLDNFTHT